MSLNIRSSLGRTIARRRCATRCAWPSTIRRGRAPFDLILANILLGPLQRIATPLRRLMAPRGRLVLSGILPSQANAVIAAYRPLALERRIDLDGWTTLVFATRTQPRRAIAPPRSAA